MQNKAEFELVRKEFEAKDVVSLYFKTTDGSKYKFIAGQYVEIKPLKVIGHGKYYTISSLPSDELVRITIKRQGVVSSAIMDLNIGDKIFFDGPYGNFYPEKNNTEIVMLAGGIGITPFISFLKTCVNSNSILIYSNKTKEDIVFLDDLTQMSKINKKLKVVYCLTQEKNKDLNFDEFSRIDKNIIEKYVPHNKNKNYYICGSISFVSDMWKIVKSIGVNEDNIYTESFY